MAFPIRLPAIIDYNEVRTCYSHQAALSHTCCEAIARILARTVLERERIGECRSDQGEHTESNKHESAEAEHRVHLGL